MSYTLSSMKSRVQSTETDQMWFPSNPRGASKYPVVLCHGANTPTAFAHPTWANLARMGAALANAGIPCVAPSDGLDRYMNDTEMSRVDACAAALNTALAARGFACSTTKIIPIGFSMGGGTAGRYASLNPTKVAAIAAIIPMANLIRNYRTDTPASIRASAATAWALAAPKTTTATCSWSTGTPNTITIVSGQIVSGDIGREIYHASFPLGTKVTAVVTTTVTVDGTGATANGSTQAVSVMDVMPTSSPNADLIALAPAIASAGIPNRWYYVTDDPYITSSDVTALATAAGGTATALTTGTGHADGTVKKWCDIGSGEFSDLINFVKANGA